MRRILHKFIKRELPLLIIYLNLKDMFEIILVELEIFGVNIIYGFVYGHNFLILIFELL